MKLTPDMRMFWFLPCAQMLMDRGYDMLMAYREADAYAKRMAALFAVVPDPEGRVP